MALSQSQINSFLGTQSSAPTALSGSNVPAAMSASQYILNGLAGLGKDFQSATESVATNTAAAQKDAATSVAGDVTTAGQKLNKDANGTVIGEAKGVADVGEGLLTSGSDILQGIFAPVTGAIKSLTDAAGDNKDIQAFAQSKPVSSFLDTVNSVGSKLDAVAQKHPEASKDISSALNLLLAGVGGEAAGGEGGILDSAKQGVGAVKDDIVAGAAKTKTMAQRIMEAKEPPLQKPAPLAEDADKSIPADTAKADKDIWDIVQPKATPKVVESYRNAGNTTAATKLKGETLNPGDSDKKVMDAVRPLYESGDLKPDDAPDTQVKAISRKVSETNSQVKSFVADNNAPIELSNFDKALEDAKSAAPKVFGDASKAYDDVIEKAKSLLKTGTPSTDDAEGFTLDDSGPAEGHTHTDSQSMLKARQAFGKWAKDNVTGAFKKNAAGGLTDTDNARVLAVRNVYNEMNNAVADSLPENSPYRSMLKNESGMLDAIKNINGRAGGLQKSEISQFLKKHPYVKYSLELGGAGAVGAFVEQHL